VSTRVLAVLLPLLLLPLPLPLLLLLPHCCHCRFTRSGTLFDNFYMAPPCAPHVLTELACCCCCCCCCCIVATAGSFATAHCLTTSTLPRKFSLLLPLLLLL
jgi:hypothetical protein